MDKEYIKMSERALEVQKDWKIEDGDCCIFYDDGKTPRFKRIINCLWREVDRDKYIWLPSQDDLQGMVKNNFNDIYHLCESIAGYCIRLSNKYNQTGDKIYVFTSMEQLWLAFVMKELYSKYWDGTNWKKYNG